MPYNYPGSYSAYSGGGLGKALTEDLVSWWKLNETSGTRADSVGSNTLSDNNTVLAAGGVGSHALTLDGTSQYLSVADPFAPPTAFTISAWIYPTTVAAGTHVIAAQGKGTDNTLAWILYLSGATPSFYKTSDGTTPSTVATSGIVAINEWNLITVRWNGTTLTCYTNTTSGTGQAVAGTVFNSTADMTVGAHGSVASNFFGGRIQNLAIWNNTDKGASIASELYNSGRGLRYAQLTDAQKVGLFDFWPLGEASGNRVGSYAATALAPTGAPGRRAGIVNSAKTSTGADFVSANNESLSVVSNASLQTGDIDFTWAGWVNVTSLPGVNGYLLGSKAHSTAASGREWLVQVAGSGAGNDFNFAVYNGAAGTQVGLVGTTVAVAGEWTFVVAWHDSAANTVNIQINNATPESAATTGTVGTTTQPYFLGFWQGGIAGWNNGSMEEVGFWKRVLTSAERTYLYNNGVGRTYATGKVV